MKKKETRWCTVEREVTPKRESADDTNQQSLMRNQTETDFAHESKERGQSILDDPLENQNMVSFIFSLIN